MLRLLQHVQPQLQGGWVDPPRSEPGWATVIWNTVRNGLLRRLVATRATTVATAAGALAVIAAGAFVLSNGVGSPDADIAASGRVEEPGGGLLAESAQAFSATSEVAPADPAALAAAGKDLAAHRGLVLSQAARAALTAGEVDARVIAALRLLVDRHMVQVTSFDADGPMGPRNTVTINCIDKMPVDARAKATADVLGFFGDLPAELAPRSVLVVTQGKATVIVASYSDSTS